MSKITGTIAFVGGVLLIVMSITGILIKNEKQAESSQELVTEVIAQLEAEVDAEHDSGQAVPQWLSFAMYTTLIISGAFTIIQVSRFGLSTEPSTMSTAAFVGGMVLVGLGFMATLAVNEQNFREHEESIMAVKIIEESMEEHDAEEHGSSIPEELRILMMATLFISGGVTTIHVSKYGLA
jgi:Na+/H+ antiporter NhaA